MRARTIDEREGLRGLLRAVLHPKARKEHPAARTRRIHLCLAWCPGDTHHAVLDRNPNLARSPEHLLERMSRLRKHLPKVHRGRHLHPAQIAECYLDAVFQPQPMVH